MATRRRAVRTGRKGKYVWTVIVVGPNLTIAPTQNLDIVEGADWQAGSAKQWATLVRIRGWIAWLSDAVTEGTITCNIGVYDEDVVSPATTSPCAYVEEDILWTDGRMAGIAGEAQANPATMTIDVKAKRRIYAGTDVRFSARTDGEDGQISGVLRALLYIP